MSLKPLAVAASLGLSLSKVYALAKSGALPWVSEEEAHGRHIIVSRSVDTRCRFCDSPEAIEVDTSEGEYLPFKCCAPCFARMAASSDA